MILSAHNLFAVCLPFGLRVCFVSSHKNWFIRIKQKLQSGQRSCLRESVSFFLFLCLSSDRKEIVKTEDAVSMTVKEEEEQAVLVVSDLR